MIALHRRSVEAQHHPARPEYRFRPPDIYAAKRKELEEVHRGNSSLSAGIPNALKALRQDGVIARVIDVYARAVDGRGAARRP